MGGFRRVKPTQLDTCNAFSVTAVTSQFHTFVYNKLFTKILDSSIWLEPTATRIVWLTLIAGMDEDGFVALASVANLAHRARVEIADAAEAVRILEAPDENSSDPDNEGRRIERVTGGWMVLNAPKYRDLVTRTVSREQTRIRVARYREKKSGNAPCNGDVTPGNGTVTQSEAVTEASTPPSMAREKKDLRPTLPESIRIAQLFGRKPDTRWADKEIATFRKCLGRGVFTAENFELIETYYRIERSKGDNGRHRRDLGTFLNNFDTELDRARAASTHLANGNGKKPEYRMI